MVGSNLSEKGVGEENDHDYACNPNPVLGAIAPVLSTFGKNCQRFLEHIVKMTFA